MSSSADELPYGWEEFTPRPAPGEMAPPAPGRALGTVLQQFQDVVGKERVRADAAIAKFREPVVELAVHLWRLGQVLADVPESDRLARRLRLVHRQMAAQLTELGIEVVDPVGEPLQRVADSVDVLHWRHDGRFDSEVVDETVEPIVRDGDLVARLGQVVVGAPATTPVAATAADPVREPEPTPEPQKAPAIETPDNGAPDNAEREHEETP